MIVVDTECTHYEIDREHQRVRLTNLAPMHPSAAPFCDENGIPNCYRAAGLDEDGWAPYEWVNTPLVGGRLRIRWPDSPDTLVSLRIASVTVPPAA